MKGCTKASIVELTFPICIALGATLSVLCLASAVPALAASSAESPCPNASVRQYQGSDVLSQCRAWELVSPRNTGGSFEPNGRLTAARFSRSGTHVAMAFLGAAGNTTSGNYSNMLATRAGGRWDSASMAPPGREQLASGFALQAASPEFDEGIFTAYGGFRTPSPDTTLVRYKPGKPQNILYDFKADGEAYGYTIASENLDRVFAPVRNITFAPSEPTGVENLYEFDGGTPKLVGLLPGNTIPECGINGSQGSQLLQFGSAYSVEMSSHQVSFDGSRVFFNSRGDDCSGPAQLYMRDIQEEDTTLISPPPISGSPGSAVFLQASPEGSEVFFFTTANLVAADGDGAGDVYRAEPGQDLFCVTCRAGAGAEVTEPDPGTGLGYPLVSEKGSHVYFESAKAQVNGEGTGNAYDIWVWERQSGDIHFVAPSNGLTPLPACPCDETVGGSELSSDGTVLLFRSNSSGLDVLSGRPNGGTSQYYRYDDSSGALDCISCPSIGTPNSSVTSQLGSQESAITPGDDHHAMDAGGDVIAFISDDALVPEDINHDRDLYEWHAGEVHLLTDGVTRTSVYSPFLEAYVPNLSLFDVSRDGKGVLFGVPVDLTRGFPREHVAMTVYAAEANGGELPQLKMECEQEACQGAPSQAASLSLLGSRAYTGRESSKSRCLKCKKR